MLDASKTTLEPEVQALVVHWENQAPATQCMVTRTDLKHLAIVHTSTNNPSKRRILMKGKRQPVSRIDCLISLSR